MTKLFHAIVDIYTKEEINDTVLETLSKKELEIFYEVLIGYNKELELFVSKKRELVFLKKGCFNLIITRAWVMLNERDREKLAKFFYDVKEFVDKNF